MFDRQSMERSDLSQMVEAADRAGAIVTEHVRSIVEAAEERATEIQRSAQQEADTTRVQASEAAARILERIDAIEGQLGGLIESLRREAERLTSEMDRRGGD